MPICSNPDRRRIRVPVGGASVVLIVRNYTDREFARFMGNRFGFRRKGKIEDHSMQSRIRFIDSILMDIEAFDSNGDPDSITFVRPDGGKTSELNPSVENWKSYINPSWKIAAALELEGERAEIENSTAKN